MICKDNDADQTHQEANGGPEGLSCGGRRIEMTLRRRAGVEKIGTMANGLDKQKRPIEDK